MLSLTVSLGVEGPRAQGEGDAVAVVAHPSNVHERMTTSELCDVLLGERQRWPTGAPIDVILPPPGSRAWSAILRATCRTNEERFRRQVTARRAFGRASRPPVIIETDAEMVQRVAESERALGFVAAAALDGTVKVLLIDGRSAGDPAYPIRQAREAPLER